MLWQAFIKGFWTKWHPDKIKKSSPYQNKAMNRLGHLDYYPWVLGDKMSKNPKISAVSISDSNPLFRNHFDDNEWAIYTKTIQNPRVNTS